MGRLPFERGAFVTMDSDGEFDCVAWPRSGARKREEFHGVLPPEESADWRLLWVFPTGDHRIFAIAADTQANLWIDDFERNESGGSRSSRAR